MLSFSVFFSSHSDWKVFIVSKGLTERFTDSIITTNAHQRNKNKHYKHKHTVHVFEINLQWVTERPSVLLYDCIHKWVTLKNKND